MSQLGKVQLVLGRQSGINKVSVGGLIAALELLDQQLVQVGRYFLTT